MKINDNNVLKVGSRNFNIENWIVYHPNGKHMFTCGEKKAKWYIDKGLADYYGDYAIKFKFIPKGNGFEDNEIFGRALRKPICVVSGMYDQLQRHHITPYCYRTYFPEKFKSKNHHDVVLINCDLHAEYEQHANEFKDEIARMYGVKTISEFNLEYSRILKNVGRDEGIAINNIHAIIKGYNKLSEEKKIEKLQNISFLTEIHFNTLSNYNYYQMLKLYLYLKDKHFNEVEEFKKQNIRKLYDHGYHVVKKLNTESKIEEFVKLWRKHFIETMNPQYMPVGWSIDFRVKTKLA